MCIEQELKKLKYDDLEHNKKILLDFRTKIVLSKGIDIKISEDDFVKNLYIKEDEACWVTSQCLSAIKQIDKFFVNEQFHQNYGEIFSESEYLMISKELILDLMYLEYLTKSKYFSFEGQSSAENNVSSMQFFWQSKFSYFQKKYIIQDNGRPFDIASAPTFIRQSIELKIKNMIGLEEVKSQKGGFKQISISSILDFFKESDLLKLPLPIDHLIYINRWTNDFIHSGVASFCWQTLEAIDRIECLFSIKEDSLGTSMRGFSYIRPEVKLEDLKKAMDDHFKCVFVLNESSIEGRRIA